MALPSGEVGVAECSAFQTREEPIGVAAVSAKRGYLHKACSIVTF